jgi:uncharacterized RDD family membrane protein YckC
MFTIIGGDGKEYGPATADQIRSWIAAGRANLETKARAVGSEEWRRLGDFAEFGVNPLPPPVGDSTFAAPGAAVAVAAPEAELAGRGTRLGAAVIDRLLASLAALPGILLMGPAFVQIMTAAMRGEQPDFEAIAAGSFVLGALLGGFGLLVLFVIQVWMLSTRGQSIGKRILGIRIVMCRDHANPGFLHAWLLRNFVPGLIGVVPYVGFIFVLVDVCFIFGEQRRCVHDYIAGTKVVKI